MKYAFFVSVLLSTVVSNALNIYSARKEFLIKPLVEAYEKETGKKVTYITGSAEPLLQRILAEKDKTSADILMTVDAGNLWNASKKGAFQSIDSAVLNKAIPASYRANNSEWFGLSLRARTIFYNPDLIKSSELSSYAALAEKKFKSKLCLRTSKKVYNQSLVAMMLDHSGEKKTKKVLSGWVSNLAQPVFSNDTKLLEAIASGDCAVGIANTYYYGRILKNKPNFKTKIFWANQKSSGVHVNISGAGVVKYSKNKKQAVEFLEWLVSPAAQKILSQTNMEYPVTSSVELAPVVKSWGDFKADKKSLGIAGQNQAQAVRLMGEAGYK